MKGNKKVKFSVITLFPNSIKSYFEFSILKKAIEKDLIEIEFFNPIDFVEKGRVDDKSYGGGPGMVIKAIPVLKAWKEATKNSKEFLTVFFSPRKNVLNNKKVKFFLSEANHFILLCGHYEGIDERVAKMTKARKVSIGKYTLTGGEIPSLCFIDAISRNIKGVLGNADSDEDKRSSSGACYTRPENIDWEGKNYKVPEILLSGKHKDIEAWREKN